MKTSEERTQHILEKTKKQEALKRRKRVKWISIASGALALTLVFVFSFTLFNPSTETGNPNDYALLAEKIDEIRKRSDSGNTDQDPNGGSDSPSSDWSGGTGPAGDQYVEVTNNQVSGIVEADVFKRSNNYIFYLCYDFGKDKYENGGWVDIIAPYYFLRVYSIAGKNSALVTEFNIPAAEGFRYGSYFSFIMYLSQDCSTITITAPCRDIEQDVYYTEVISIDVSNPRAPKEIGRTYVSGIYKSSRMVGETLLLATNFTVKYNCDFKNPEDYVPAYGDLMQRSLLTMKDIYLPENANTAEYTVLASINAKTLAINDASALFSYTSDIYVSENYLFATYTADVDTEIAFFDYDEDSLNFCGTIAAKGTIVNQYSMDESDNILRVFTTSLNDNNECECNLQCFDLDTFELIASVENFSDPNEEIMSVRFYGDTAYVCTAIFIREEHIVNDPVFEFDLSDYDNITWKDTGTIPGYSLSLVGFTDGTLLGFGYNDSEDTLKLELYRTVADSVESVAAYIAPNTTFPDDFKAYFIDAENGLIGLGIKYEYERFRYVDQYLLLRYDAETQSIEVLYTFELFSDGYPNDSTVVIYGGHTYTTTLRGCFIDGYFYLIGKHDFQILEF
ncbi:MAG: beta-propeller domain-containing protein [Clostridiales bacterium]|nr:beta-propeller domain-containing protein [Clostridiales bacterium]